MVRCDKCGNKVADGKKFCVICGQLMENPQIYIEDQEDKQKPRCEIGAKVVLFVLGILIIAGLTIFIKDYVIENKTDQVNITIV